MHSKFFKLTTNINTYNMFKVNMHTIKITLIFIIVCLIPQNINYNHIYHLTLLIQDNKNFNMLAFNLTYKHALHQHKK